MCLVLRAIFDEEGLSMDCPWTDVVKNSPDVLVGPKMSMKICMILLKNEWLELCGNKLLMHVI